MHNSRKSRIQERRAEEKTVTKYNKLYKKKPKTTQILSPLTTPLPRDSSSDWKSSVAESQKRESTCSSSSKSCWMVACSCWTVAWGTCWKSMLRWRHRRTCPGTTDDDELLPDPPSISSSCFISARWASVWQTDIQNIETLQNKETLKTKRCSKRALTLQYTTTLHNTDKPLTRTCRCRHFGTTGEAVMLQS